jgi:hypothetical protein
MADRNDEEILRAILEKGSDRAKQQAAAAIAQQPPTPADPPVVKQQKKKKKGLTNVAGALGKQKFYYGPGGTIVDKDGAPAPPFIADMLRDKDQMSERIRESVVPSSTRSQQSNLNAVNGELNRIVSSSRALARTHDQLIKKIPQAFGQIDLAIRNIVDNHHAIVQSLVKQNEDLQDKVVEALTGAKAPTRAAGAVTRPKRGAAARAVSASRAATGAKLRNTVRRKEVLDRRDRMMAVREERNMAMIKRMGIGGMVLGGAAGAITSMITKAPEGTIPTTGGGGAAPGPAPAAPAPPPPFPSPGPTVPTGPITKFEGLGSISQKYESGRKGVHTVSSGRDDPGGVSYGAHQLASRTGSMARYLASAEARQYASQFAGLQPGTEPFNQKYRQIASSDPQGFAASQKAFITRTHFDPVSKHAANLGWSVADPRIQEALYSMGVQHGGARKIVSRAGSPTGKTIEQQVAMLYAARKAYVTDPSQTPQMSAESRRREVNRYIREERDVLAISPTQGTAVAAAPAAPTGVPERAMVPSPGTPNAAETQPGAQGATSEKPSNVTVGRNADLSKVDPDLLKRLYGAAKEYGQPVSINSAYRSDEYQAQLWVRANVYREPGIYSPARPAQTMTINYKGQQHTVQGSGRGSAHGRGNAVDISPGPALDPFLRKYGLHRPHASFDPPHVEKIGGSSYAASSGAPTAAPGAVSPTVQQGRTVAAGSTARAMEENMNAGAGQVVVMNNNRVISQTRTIVRGGSVPMDRPGTRDVNPLDIVAGVATGYGVGKALRLF